MPVHFIGMHRYNMSQYPDFLFTEYLHLLQQQLRIFRTALCMTQMRTILGVKCYIMQHGGNTAQLHIQLSQSGQHGCSLCNTVRVDICKFAFLFLDKLLNDGIRLFTDKF